MRCFHGVESDSNSLGGTILKATLYVAFNIKNFRINLGDNMKQLILGLVIGLAVGLTCSACSLALSTIKADPMTIVLTERNFVQTTKVTTEEGTYRIFTIEGNNRNGVGITAVKIK